MKTEIKTQHNYQETILWLEKKEVDLYKSNKIRANLSNLWQKETLAHPFRSLL